MPLAYDGWTRKELEAEARRRGIRDADRLGRDGLVRRLRSQPPPGPGRARDRLARLAKGAVRGAVAEVRGRLPGLSRLFAEPRSPALPFPSSPPPLRPATPARSTPPARPSAEDDSGLRNPFDDQDPDTRELLGLGPSEGGTASDDPGPPRSDAPSSGRSFRPPPAARRRNGGTATWLPPPPSAFPPRPDGRDAADDAPSPSEPPRPAPAPRSVPPPPALREAGSDRRPTPPPADRSAGPASTPAADPKVPPADAGEPIRTRTFARLLARQGHGDRAIALLEALARERPGETELAAEIDALRRGAASPEVVAGAKPRSEAPEREHVRAGLERPSGSANPVPIEVSQDPSGEVVVRWYLTEAGVTPGRHLAGPGAALVVRLVAIVPDATAVVANQVTEHPADGLAGRARFENVPSGARITAAVGWRARGRFVSVAHGMPPRGQATGGAPAR